MIVVGLRQLAALLLIIALVAFAAGVTYAENNENKAPERPGNAAVREGGRGGS